MEWIDFIQYDDKNICFNIKYLPHQKQCQELENSHKDNKDSDQDLRSFVHQLRRNYDEKDFKDKERNQSSH